MIIFWIRSHGALCMCTALDIEDTIAPIIFGEKEVCLYLRYWNWLIDSFCFVSFLLFWSGQISNALFDRGCILDGNRIICQTELESVAKSSLPFQKPALCRHWTISWSQIQFLVQCLVFALGGCQNWKMIRRHYQKMRKHVLQGYLMMLGTAWMYGRLACGSLQGRFR